MKEMGGIGRWALILLLLGNVYGGFAQDANTARAQHIYESVSYTHLTLPTKRIV